MIARNREYKRITTGYTPRAIQEKVHRKLRRFNVLVWHRRMGKTVFSLNDMLDRGVRNPLYRPQYAYIAPTYGQAKRVAWEYLKDFTRSIPGVKVHEGDLRIDIPRPGKNDFVRIMLLGAENPNSLLGLYLDGVILDEYAVMDPAIWNITIRPALSDRKGWAIFIGTPRGDNHFKLIYEHAKKMMKAGDPDWFASLYRASDTGIIDHKELMAAKSTMKPEEFDQEFEVSFTAAIIGAYFKDELVLADKEGRVCRVPYDRNALVSTYWDLGMDDTNAIWFVQSCGQEIHVIDYMEQHGKGFDWYAKELQSKPYIYHEHFFPHDGAVRELGTGKSRQESFAKLSGQRVNVLPRWSVADTIHAGRQIFNKCWFDELNCELGLKALRNYQSEFVSKDGVFKKQPKHNWASHGGSAFRYLGQSFKPDSERRPSHTLPRMAAGAYDELGGFI